LTAVGGTVEVATVGAATPIAVPVAGVGVAVAAHGNSPEPLVLLIDDWHGYSAIGIPTGTQLLSLLERSYKFRWYVTDSQLSFLLCRNDHDIVILCEPQ
jgi:hypothetical protein